MSGPCLLRESKVSVGDWGKGVGDVRVFVEAVADLERGDALREALADGTIDAIATDHAPHSPLEKDCEFAEASPGMIGLELVLPMLLDLVQKGALPLARLVTALTRAPAGIIGIEAPSLREGAKAELCLVAPEARWKVEPSRLRTKSRNTPLLGQTLTGRVRLTLAAGSVVFDALAEAGEVIPGGDHGR